MERWLYALSIGGTMVVFLWRGWRWAVGYLAGAAVSAFSFRWIHGIVDALAPGAKPPMRSAPVILGLRYVLLGVAGYALVTAFAIPTLALVLGLGVTVGAVFLEIGYQLTRPGGSG
jgi:hypothetical protein